MEKVETSKIHKIIGGFKICPQCLVNLPVTCYYKNNQSTNNIMSWCKDCCKRLRPQNKDYFKKYYQENKIKRRASDRKRRYKVSEKEFQKQFFSQGSCCAICKTTDSGKQHWCVDHDHKTGIFRAVLCTSCNSMLGYAKDNSDTLKRAAAYIDMQYVV